MGLFDRFKAAVGDFETQVSRFTNKEFGEGCMAIAAAVMFADGSCDPEEKAKLAKFIQVNPVLKNFDRTALISFFNGMVDQFDLDFEMGMDQALKEVSQVSDPDQKLTMLRLAVMVAKSDADGMEPAEEAVIRRFCNAMGVPASEVLR